MKRADLLTGPAACERLFVAIGGAENVSAKDLDRLRASWKRNQDVFIAREIRRRARRTA